MTLMIIFGERNGDKLLTITTGSDENIVIKEVYNYVGGLYGDVEFAAQFNVFIIDLLNDIEVNTEEVDGITVQTITPHTEYDNTKYTLIDFFALDAQPFATGNCTLQVVDGLEGMGDGATLLLIEWPSNQFDIEDLGLYYEMNIAHLIYIEVL